MRDQVIDYVVYWSERAQLPATVLYRWIGLPESTFYNWRQRYGRANEHNGRVPRDFWVKEWERAAIIEYYTLNRLEGYRRVAFMMHGVCLQTVSSINRVLGIWEYKLFPSPGMVTKLSVGTVHRWPSATSLLPAQ